MKVKTFKNGMQYNNLINIYEHGRLKEERKQKYIDSVAKFIDECDKKKQNALKNVMKASSDEELQKVGKEFGYYNRLFSIAEKLLVLANNRVKF